MIILFMLIGFLAGGPSGIFIGVLLWCVYKAFQD